MADDLNRENGEDFIDIEFVDEFEISKDEEEKIIDVTFEEIEDEPVTENDKKAKEILADMKKVSELLMKATLAYANKRREEAEKKGFQKMSEEAEKISKDIGAIKEFDNRKQELKQAHKIAVESISEKYDKQINDLKDQIQDLKEENMEKRAEQWALAKSRRKTKREEKSTTKDASKTMQKALNEKMKEISELVQKGDTKGVEKAQEEYAQLANEYSKVTKESASKVANQNKLYRRNKRQIARNKKDIIKLQDQIEQLIDQKSQEIEQAHETKSTELATLQKPSIFKRIGTLLAKFRLDKTKQFDEKVMQPFKTKLTTVAENAGKGMVQTGKKAVKKVKDFGENTINRMDKFVEKINEATEQSQARINEIGQNPNLDAQGDNGNR